MQRRETGQTQCHLSFIIHFKSNFMSIATITKPTSPLSMSLNRRKSARRVNSCHPNYMVDQNQYASSNRF